jgi:Transglycosylase SLT domain
MTGLRFLRTVTCIIAILAASMLLGGRARNLPIDPFAAFVIEASRRFIVPEHWVRAVMRVESDGRPRARSKKGAMGVMQIMPGTWTELRSRYHLGVAPYDPHDKILRLRCAAAKAVDPQKRFIVGIAMDASGVEGSSEDFVFLDTAEWTAEEIQKAQQTRTELEYFTEGNAVMFRLSEDEYPGSRKAVDVPKLADELSSLTVSESVELAGMLKEIWARSDPVG